MPTALHKRDYVGGKDGKRRRRRRVMEKLTLDEISFVNRPAQEPALAAIMKSASPKELLDDARWQEVEKVLMRPRSGETRDAFVSRFMSSAAAKREFPERDQRLAVAMQQFRRGAGSSKAADDSFEKRFGVTTVVEGHQHVMDVMGPNGVMSRGETSYDRGMDAEYSHSHEWIRRDDGSILILMADGHEHDIMEMIDISVEPKEASADKIGNSGGKEKEMTTQKSAEELSAQIEDLNKKLSNLEGENEILKAEASFSDAEKSYYEDLDDQAKKEFRTASPEARSSQIQKREEDDPAIFKAADGTVYRKSDDPRLIELAKREDAREIEFRKMQEEREDVRIEKFVDENLKHHPGDMDVRKAIVKAVEAIADEKVRDGALDALKAKDAQFAPAFRQVGVNGQPDLNKDAGMSDRQGAQQELRKKANEMVEQDSTGKMNYYDAYEKACRANPDLYAKARAV